MEISETDLFDTLTIQNDQISYVKHVLAPLYVFFTLFGCLGGGLPRGPGHNLLMHFSSFGSSKMEISETWGAIRNRQLYILRMYCKGCISFNFSIFFIIYMTYRKNKKVTLPYRKNKKIQFFFL